MKTLIPILFLFVSFSGIASPLNTIEDTKTLSENMVKHFLKNEFDQGLALVKPLWPLPEVEIDGLANQIRTQWPIVEQRFGQPTGYEHVRTEKIGDSFVRHYYLHKFQNHAIYWQVSFYRPNDKWVVNGVTFKDMLEPLYQVVE
ncbi:hypothetical protein [Ferrimonas futtsuensis]|uniref:hypothetical protein n=1 Tax=Ferrimonas futtsuensis TaxID=364764 RepID=UPI000425D421|nr:hypothetical protein [Ferrimonas futtsuensis]